MRLSRSALLPQVQGDATGTLTREETAASSLGQQAQRQGEASVSFSQYVFSDQTWAEYTIAQHQQEGRVADRRRTRLDVVLRARPPTSTCSARAPSRGSSGRTWP